MVWNLIGFALGVWLMVRGFYYLASKYPAPPPDPKVVRQRGDLASLRNAFVADEISLEEYERDVEYTLSHGYRPSKVWATF